MNYHKINGLYKRYPDGPQKGKFIMGEWAVPEIGYLADNQWEFTEKIDGTNIAIQLKLNDGVLVSIIQGRSEKSIIPADLLIVLRSLFPTAPDETGRYSMLLDYMKEHQITQMNLYGEGYGERIQNGGLYRNGVGFCLFDIKVGDWWLRRNDVISIAEQLSLEVTPVIGSGTLHDAIDIVSTGITFSRQGGIVRWGRNGLYSKWGDFLAEGIVARPTIELFDRAGRRIITKIKTVDFK